MVVLQQYLLSACTVDIYALQLPSPLTIAGIFCRYVLPSTSTVSFYRRYLPSMSKVCNYCRYLMSENTTVDMYWGRCVPSLSSRWDQGVVRGQCCSLALEGGSNRYHRVAWVGSYFLFYIPRPCMEAAMVEVDCSSVLQQLGLCSNCQSHGEPNSISPTR